MDAHRTTGFDKMMADLADKLSGDICRYLQNWTDADAARGAMERMALRGFEVYRAWQGRDQTKSYSYERHLGEKLRNPDEAADYLRSHLSEGICNGEDKDDLGIALADIAIANGVVPQIAKRLNAYLDRLRDE